MKRSNRGILYNGEKLGQVNNFAYVFSYGKSTVIMNAKNRGLLLNTSFCFILCVSKLV